MLKKIEKIEKIEKRDRYDITVEGTHNFYANGILIHNSQIKVYASCKKGEIAHKWMTTKNYNKKGLHLVESETNFYWRATRAINLWDIIAQWAGAFHFNDSSIEETVVEVFGEALPCQEFKYGLTDHTMRIFDVRINGVSIPYDQVPEPFKEYWVPILYDGPYDDAENIKKLCKGMEQLSGTEANIKEGMVLRPYIDRRASDGTRLMVKIINPKYRETGDEFN